MTNHMYSWAPSGTRSLLSAALTLVNPPPTFPYLTTIFPKVTTPLSSFSFSFYRCLPVFLVHVFDFSSFSSIPLTGSVLPFRQYHFIHPCSLIRATTSTAALPISPYRSIFSLYTTIYTNTHSHSQSTLRCQRHFPKQALVDCAQRSSSPWLPDFPRTTLLGSSRNSRDSVLRMQTLR